MDYEVWFKIANLLVIPFWLLLLFLPYGEITRKYVHPPYAPFLLAVAYTFFLVLGISDGAPGGFSSVAEVMLLFENPNWLLAGWIHYLAFDLFIGTWEIRDAQNFGIRHRFVIPCLLLTFMAGPVGLGLYLLIKWRHQGKARTN